MRSWISRKLRLFLFCDYNVTVRWTDGRTNGLKVRLYDNRMKSSKLLWTGLRALIYALINALKKLTHCVKIINALTALLTIVSLNMLALHTQGNCFSKCI